MSRLAPLLFSVLSTFHGSIILHGALSHCGSLAHPGSLGEYGSSQSLDEYGSLM